MLCIGAKVRVREWVLHGSSALDVTSDEIGVVKHFQAPGGWVVDFFSGDREYVFTEEELVFLPESED